MRATIRKKRRQIQVSRKKHRQERKSSRFPAAVDETYYLETTDQENGNTMDEENEEIRKEMPDVDASVSEGSGI